MISTKLRSKIRKGGAHAVQKRENERHMGG
jgi:hypothetical protein